MVRELTPYPELEEDLLMLGHSQDEFQSAALERLLAAFKEPECGAVMHHFDDGSGMPVMRVTGTYSTGTGLDVPLICRLPRDHFPATGHDPKVPAECWRMRDAGA